MSSPAYSGDFNQVRVLFGDGNGHIGAGASYYFPYENSVTDVVTGDVDGDGDTDLALAVPNLGVAVLRNDGAGAFGPADSARRARAQSFIAVGDFNHDSRLDVAVSGDDNCAVLLGLGDGKFSGPVPTGAPSPYVVTVGDFNGDGWLDLATTTFLSGPSPSCSTIKTGLRRHNPCRSSRSATRRSPKATPVRVRPRSSLPCSAASVQPVTVAYATYDGSYATGSDYVAASGTLTIPAGQTTGTITVLVKGDRLGELDESFIVELSSPTNATVADGQGVGIIVDDEPRISISDMSKKEGRKGQTTSYIFTVTLSAAYDKAVTVSFQTVNGTAKTNDQDYVAQAGTITFRPGETTKRVTIVVKGDSKKEADEYFFLDLFGNSTNSLFTKNRGIGTIQNDD